MKQTRPSKYSNRRCEYRGKKFASLLERDRYIVLSGWERQSLIQGLETQASFQLLPKWTEGGRCVRRAASYVADFTYRLPSGRLVVEDTKGVETPVFRLKEHMMHHLLGVDIRKVRQPGEALPKEKDTTEQQQPQTTGQ
ncbi:MAG: DUF1064 domain-containing protein [Prevotellaceae bacterium]|nr:DUF1064 domain-containing protein [Prevotellaceae bacterium]